MQPLRPRPLTTEQSLRQMYVEGRIELEQFEYAIDKALRMRTTTARTAKALEDATTAVAEPRQPELLAEDGIDI